MFLQGSITATRAWDITISQVICPGEWRFSFLGKVPKVEIILIQWGVKSLKQVQIDQIDDNPNLSYNN